MNILPKTVNPEELLKVDGYFSCVPVLCRHSDGRHVGLQMAVLETGQFAPSLEESSAVSVQYCRRVF